MTKESRPGAESDGFAHTELAPTEHASGDVRSGSGPRGSARRDDLRSVGRFRIDGPLGAGGMGDVYRAYDPVLDRAVALKVLRPAFVPDGAQRMRRVVREARAAAALTHPNTVTIFEVGEAGDEVFIAMELLEGEDLRAVLDRGGASLDQKLRWLLQAARALAAAHERGLVHRDVKPENMFVVKDGTLKLLDFGIAKRDEDEGEGGGASDDMGPSSLRTSEGRRLGTPRYMAPEQRAGEATDARTDEYAWGLVAFELLTGTEGIAAVPTVTRTAGLLVPGPKPTPARLVELRAKVPELPEPIALTIARALEPNKEDRFASMAPIVAALETRAESGPPISPLPVTPFAPLAPHAPHAHVAPPTSPATTPGAADTTTLPSALVSPPKPLSPSRTRVWLGALVVASAIVAVVALRRVTPTVSPPAAPVAACSVEPAHDVAVGPNDWVTVLADRSVVVARVAADRKFLFERETPAGMVPFLRGPMFEAVGNNYEQLAVGAIRYGDFPAVLVQLDQGPIRGSFVGIWTEDHGMANQRIFGASTGLVTTRFAKEIVAISTTHEVTTPERVIPSLVEANLITAKGTRRTTIEEVGAIAPAVATSNDRVAVAYTTDAGLRFALLDAELRRIGDVQTVSPTGAAPALAFVGPTVTVFWTQDQAGKTRLMEASFSPGEAGFTPPKIAIEEPLAAFAPITVALPNGGAAVAWIASSGGPSTIRVAPVGPNGALSGPTDVAKAPSIHALRATATDSGMAMSWTVSDATARIAHVACKAQ